MLSKLRLLTVACSIALCGNALASTCSPEWQPAKTYVAGGAVSQGGINYTAKWWTLGESPKASGVWGVWKTVGQCNASPTAAPTAAPTATPTAKPTATPTAAPTATPTAKPTATPTAAPTATPTAAPTATPTTAPAPANVSRHQFWFWNNAPTMPQRAYSGKFIPYRDSLPKEADPLPINKDGLFFEFVRNESITYFEFVASPRMAALIEFMEKGYNTQPSAGAVRLRHGFVDVVTNYPTVVDQYGTNVHAQFKDGDYIGVELIRGTNSGELTIRRNGAVEIKATLPWAFKNDNFPIYLQVGSSCAVFEKNVGGCGAVVYAPFTPEADKMVTKEFLDANPDFLSKLPAPILPPAPYPPLPWPRR